MSKIKKMNSGKINKQNTKEQIKENKNIIKYNEEQEQLIKENIEVHKHLLQQSKKRKEVLKDITLEVKNPVNTLEENIEWRNIMKQDMIYNAERDSVNFKKILLEEEITLKQLQNQIKRLKQQNETLERTTN